MKFIDTLKNKHKYNNYSGLPFEMQLSKAIKQDQNRLRLLKLFIRAEKRKRCPPKATHFSTKNPIKKPAMNNKRLQRLFIAAVSHFIHPVEKTFKNITSSHKTLSASAVKVNKFQDAA